MRVNVRSIKNDNYSFVLSETATLFELKDELCKTINVSDMYCIKCIYSGEILDDLNKELKAHYNFKDNDIIIYFVRQPEIIKETVHVPEVAKKVVPVRNRSPVRNMSPVRNVAKEAYNDSDDEEDDSDDYEEIKTPLNNNFNNNGAIDDTQFKTMMDNNMFNTNNELTAADNVAIDEIEGMGFDRNMAAECYLLSNKNKEFTLNMLLG